MTDRAIPARPRRPMAPAPAERKARALLDAAAKSLQLGQHGMAQRLLGRDWDSLWAGASVSAIPDDLLARYHKGRALLDSPPPSDSPSPATPDTGLDLDGQGHGHGIGQRQGLGQTERELAAMTLLDRAAVAWKEGRLDLAHTLLLTDWAALWHGEFSDGIRIPDDLLARFYKGWAMLAAAEARADWENDGSPTASPSPATPVKLDLDAAAVVSAGQGHGQGLTSATPATAPMLDLDGVGSDTYDG